jgi:hypothetical protein
LIGKSECLVEVETEREGFSEMVTFSEFASRHSRKAELIGGLKKWKGE